MVKPNRWFVYSTLQLYKCCNSEDVSENYWVVGRSDQSFCIQNADAEFAISMECKQMLISIWHLGRLKVAHQSEGNLCLQHGTMYLLYFLLLLFLFVKVKSERFSTLEKPSNAVHTCWGVKWDGSHSVNRITFFQQLRVLKSIKVKAHS